MPVSSPSFAMFWPVRQQIFDVIGRTCCVDFVYLIPVGFFVVSFCVFMPF